MKCGLCVELNRSTLGAAGCSEAPGEQLGVQCLAQGHFNMRKGLDTSWRNAIVDDLHIITHSAVEDIYLIYLTSMSLFKHWLDLLKCLRYRVVQQYLHHVPF